MSLGSSFMYCNDIEVDMKNTFVLLLLSLAACGQKLDGDGDGFDELTGDCNDDDPNIGPAAIEICDGIDNDCIL